MFKLHTVFSLFFLQFCAFVRATQLFPGKYTIRLTCLADDSDKKVSLDPWSQGVQDFVLVEDFNLFSCQ